ncbi:MAG TPA: DUF4190 domain-containing protein [Tepidisphaeraceae bacterium]|jgi:uncharacterized membrane protein|nr:DUF4190 domain-containing protein [Tepidisphaeraceae bacterium]
MSQYPPQYPPPAPPPGFSPGPIPQGQQSNGLAITSLIMGILSCIPGVGLLAILFGALGLGKAKDPRVGGKGLAIIGIVLGLISIVAYAGIGYSVYWGFGKLKALAEPGAEFFKAVDAGDFAKARQYATGNITDADLAKARETMKSMGAYKDMKVTQADWKNEVLDCSGTVIFEKGSKSFQFKMVKVGDVYKVDKFTLE